jgi:hypothetical protein
MENIYRLLIEYDVLTKKVGVSAQVPDDMTAFGLLELARVAITKKQGEARIAVPVPANHQ